MANLHHCVFRRILSLVVVLAATSPCLAADEPLQEWQVFQGADGPTRLGYRLLIDGEFTPTGLRVNGIDPRGPCVSMIRHGANGAGRLEIGDTIMAVDGSAVTTPAQYFAALSASKPRGGRVILQVRDGRTGQESKWQVDTAVFRIVNPPVAVPTGRATGIKVVLVGLTSDPNIGKSVESDLRNIRDLVQRVPGLLPSGVIELRDNKATGANLINELNRLNVLNSETLVCYVAAHGRYQPNAPATEQTRGHEIQLDDGVLSRKELMNKLRGKGARLNILITDTCNVPAPPSILPAPREERTWSHGDNGAMAILFLDHLGELDINGASQGQAAWSDNVSGFGGYFTKSLCQCAEPSEFPGSGAISWQQLLEKTTARTSKYFRSQQNFWRTNIPEDQRAKYKSFFDQPDQFPQIFVNSTRRTN